VTRTCGELHLRIAGPPGVGEAAGGGGNAARPGADGSDELGRQEDVDGPAGSAAARAARPAQAYRTGIGHLQQLRRRGHARSPAQIADVDRDRALIGGDAALVVGQHHDR